MYKLMVVAGPNRGSSFPIHSGENWIGRQAGNEVVLVSSRISKRHCVVTVRDNEIVVSDPGSANGTFVNGALTRTKKLKVGDRISVGEFVLQLMENAKQRAAPDAVVLDLRRERQLAQRSSRRSGRGGQALALNPYAGDEAFRAAQAQQSQQPAGPAVAPIPTDPKGRFLYYFDHYVMPFFYGMNLKNEWRAICTGAIAAFILGNLVVSVQPLLESSRAGIVREVTKRARYMARQIADQNSQHLAARAESKTEIGAAEQAEGVRVAVLTDLSSRIIAPALKQNSYLANGPEALFARKAAEAFSRGIERGLAFEVDEETVAAYEPVKVLNASRGKNEVVGMAIVSIDTSQATQGLGEMGVVYSETLILTGVLALFLMLILYKLTLKPFQVLVDDMDKVLKGDMNQVTQEFKFEEMAPLWDLINSALQRVPKRGSDMLGSLAEQDKGLTIDEVSAPIRAMAEAAGMGVVVCGGDRKVNYLNSVFEEVSGIRSDSAIGQEIASLARDQAFAALLTDLFDRASASGDAVGEDFEFSGVMYRVQAVAAGLGGAVPKAFVLMVARSGTS